MRIIKASGILFTLAVCIVGKTALADQIGYPTNTYLDSDSGERNAIFVDCSPTSPVGIDCQFTQITVSYELNPSELDDHIEAELEKIAAGTAGYTGDELLKQADELCEIDRASVEKAKASATGRQLATVNFLSSIIDRSCSVNTAGEARKVFEDLLRRTAEDESHTCKVWPNIWHESFALKTSSGRQYWLSEAAPSGDCGFINLSTLRPDGLNWNYESRRIISNPDGEMALGGKCSEFDERTVSYTTGFQSHSVQCEIIEFRAF